MLPLTRPAALAAVLLVLGGLTPPARLAAADKRPMTVEDLYAFKRVTAPQISPDGRYVVPRVPPVTLAEKKSTPPLGVPPPDGKPPPRQLTDPKGKRDANPRWHPSGTSVLFESSRSGSSQLWTVSAD